MATETSGSFDEIIHPRNRLQICSMLAAVHSSEFSAIRDELDVSDSVLSKQLKILEDAGYVARGKERFGSRQRNWFRLTAAGESALTKHLAELRRIAGITPKSH